MRFSEYIHLELTGSEGSFKVKPTARLDKKHEVAVLDVMYAHREDVGLRSYDASVITNSRAEIVMEIFISKEGLNSSFRRDTFRRGGFTYDRLKKTFVREFDIWNYQTEDVKRVKTLVSFNPIRDGFRMEGTLTLKRMVELINASFESKREGIGELIRATYAETSGAALATTDEYFQLPKLTLNENEGIVVIEIPYYVRSATMNDWLDNLFGFFNGGIFQRLPVRIPNPLIGMTGINPNKDAFIIMDPCSTIRSSLKAREYERKDTTAFIFSDLIDHRLIGKKTAPLLRMFPLKSKLGINWVQFTNPHYFDVRYGEISDIKITVLDEGGAPIDFKGRISLTLHFREKES